MRILHLEDDPADAQLVGETLRSGGLEAEITVTGTREGFLEELEKALPEVVLADYLLPGFTGLDAIALFGDRINEVPFIMVTGSLGEDTAVELFRMGITDYILKNRLDKLCPAISRAVREREQARQVEIEHRERLRYENRLRLATEASGIGFFSWDLGTGQELLSDAALQILGGSPDSRVTFQDWLASVHPEDRETIERMLNRAIREDRDFQAEYRIRLPDGAVRWISALGRSTQRPDDSSRRIEGVILDITDRKMAEEESHTLTTGLEQLVEQRTAELHASEEKYRSMVEITSDCIWECDEKGRLTYLSPRFHDLSGYRPDDFIGKSFRELVRQDQSEQFVEKAMDLIHGRRPGHGLEFVLRRPDAKYTVVEVSGVPIFDADGAFRGMRGISRDITERRQLQDRMEQLLLERHALLARIPVGVFQYRCAADGRNRFEYVSPNFCSWFGETHERILEDPRTVYRAIHPDDLGSLLAEMSRVKFLVKPFSWTGRLRNGEEIRWVQIGSIPTLQANGDMIGNGTVVDVTERVRLEEELRQARLASDAANLAKSEFLSNMSHEIRTPLNGILGMTQILGLTSLDRDQQECLQTLRRSSQSLLSLINGVLDLSKIEAGQMHLEETDFFLRASLQEVMQTQVSLVGAKGLRLETEIPASVPDDIRGDSLRLRQILLNLLGNAIKFTEAGRIRISVSACERKGKRALFLFRVSDSGIGIAPEAMERIFQPFSQADGSTTRLYGGTGLGLPISRRLAELMGGRLWAESAPGEGSTFFLEVPFGISGTKLRSRVGQDDLWRQDTWEGPSLRILLVDDEPTNRLVTARYLGLSGHTVLESPDGEDALEKLRAEPVDLILMDIQMPKMSGIEAVRRIREREGETGRHTPLIALTARALRHEQEQILGEGFEGYVSKPVDFRVLFREIRRCLGIDSAEAVEASEVPVVPERMAISERDKAELIPLLARIGEMLGGHRLEVFDRIEELERLLPDRETVGALRMQARKYDFKAAAKQLAELHRELDLPE